MTFVQLFTPSSPPTNSGSGIVNLGTQAPTSESNQPQSFSGSNPPRDRAAKEADKWKARFYKVGTWLICGAALAVVIWLFSYSNNVSNENGAINADINNINNSINQLRSDKNRDIDRLQSEIDRINANKKQ